MVTVFRKNVVFNIRTQPPASSCTGKNQQLKMVTWHKVKGEKRAHNESLSYHRWSNGSTIYQACLHTNTLTFRSGLKNTSYSFSHNYPTSNFMILHMRQQTSLAVVRGAKVMNWIHFSHQGWCCGLSPNSVTQLTKHKKQPPHTLPLSLPKSTSWLDHLTKWKKGKRKRSGGKRMRIKQYLQKKEKSG